jgi:hypothetical protein
MKAIERHLSIGGKVFNLEASKSKEIVAGKFFPRVYLRTHLNKLHKS